ncbi:MAG: hypothetical protein ACU0BS_07980 [Hasllibacter sp.]
MRTLTLLTALALPAAAQDGGGSDRTASDPAPAEGRSAEGGPTAQLTIEIGELNLSDARITLTLDPENLRRLLAALEVRAAQAATEAAQSQGE